MAKYFPVSQDFNDDPETWQLTDEFGDRALRTWIEILSILDRNRNEWKLVERWEFVLGKKLRMSPAKCRLIVGWMLAKHWLIVGQYSADGSPHILHAPKYEKYHKMRSGVSLPPNLTYPNLTISSHQNAQKSNASPSAGFDKSKKKEGDLGMSRSMNLSPELKLVADKVYNSDRDKFQRIAAWIGQGRKHAYLESDMAEALSQFWEYRFIDDWYPYLDQILDKVVKTRHAREHDLETERLRREAREFTEGKPALSLVRGLSEAKAVK